MGELRTRHSRAHMEEGRMSLRIATPEDSNALIQFHKEFIRPGQVAMKVDRCKDYFLPYEIQGEQHLTYLFEQENKIEGSASFVIRDVMLNGKVKTVAFGRDLRISNNRNTVLEWHKHFLPVLEEVFKSFDCRYMFSMISQNDMQALNAFIRPRPSRRLLPRYYLFRRFNLVSLHGQLPWAENPLPHLRIKHAQSHHLDALVYYVSQKSKEKELSTAWDENSFNDKLQRWKNFKIENFLIAMDKDDNIVGCVAPWSSQGIQELIPFEYDLRGHNFRQFLKFGEYLGWTRSITKPAHRLPLEDSFKFRYLNFLHADNADIFESLLFSAWNNAHKNEFLVYTQMRADHYLRPPAHWIHTHTPYGIYLVMPPDQTPPEFLHPRNERTCEVEPFFI